MVGEIEVPLAVEDKVVRALEAFALALAVEGAHFAAVRTDALDLAADVVVRLLTRIEPLLARYRMDALGPFEAAVLGDVDCAVRADGRSVRAAASGREHGLHAGRGVDADERAALDVGDKDVAAGQLQRALGEAKAVGHFAIVHKTPPASEANGKDLGGRVLR